jgi:hypothetical protein
VFRRSFPRIRDDHLSLGADCGGKDVPVVRVRQLQAVDQVFVASDQAICDGLPHQLAEAHDPLLGQVWIPAKPCPRHLRQDLVGPLRLNQTRPGDAYEQVALRVAVQRIGVVEDDERPGPSPRPGPRPCA